LLLHRRSYEGQAAWLRWLEWRLILNLRVSGPNGTSRSNFQPQGQNKG
jgi:hypothetical protein